MSLDAPKEPALLRVLQRLRADLGPDAFVVCDHWEADRCAVGIAKPSEPDRLAYISLFNCSAGTYYLELESPPRTDGPISEGAVSCEAIRYAELRELVAKHLHTGAGSAR